MKRDDLMILGLALAAAFFILRRPAGAVAVVGARPVSSGAPSGATLVREWAGWKYYSDGTAIDPFGAYYKDGQKIWDPVFGAV